MITTVGVGIALFMLLFKSASRDDKVGEMSDRSLLLMAGTVLYAVGVYFYLCEFSIFSSRPRATIWMLMYEIAFEIGFLLVAGCMLVFTKKERLRETIKYPAFVIAITMCLAIAETVSKFRTFLN